MEKRCSDCTFAKKNENFDFVYCTCADEEVMDMEVAEECDDYESEYEMEG